MKWHTYGILGSQCVGILGSECLGILGSECLGISVSPAKKERGREREKERVTQVWCILHRPLATL